MASSQGYHEAEESLLLPTRDRHRAWASVQEELEAVDWYDQRIDAAEDQELAAILAHNRDEEKEHAAMLMEWLRRRDPGFETMLRRYLFTESSIVGEEGADAGGDASGSGTPGGDLGIRNLRGATNL